MGHVSIRVHGSGVAAAGSYPTITTDFDFDAARKDANSNSVNWSVSNNQYSGSTNGFFNYWFYAAISVNDPDGNDLHTIISKGTTSGEGWWNSMSFSNPSGTIEVDENTTIVTVYVWVRERGCMNDGHYCFDNGDSWYLVGSTSIAIDKGGGGTTGGFNCWYDANGGMNAPAVAYFKDHITVRPYADEPYPMYPQSLKYYNGDDYYYNQPVDDGFTPTTYEMLNRTFRYWQSYFGYAATLTYRIEYCDGHTTDYWFNTVRFQSYIEPTVNIINVIIKRPKNPQPQGSSTVIPGVSLDPTEPGSLLPGTGDGPVPEEYDYYYIDYSLLLRSIPGSSPLTWEPGIRFVEAPPEGCELYIAYQMYTADVDPHPDEENEEWVEDAPQNRGYFDPGGKYHPGGRYPREGTAVRSVYMVAEWGPAQFMPIDLPDRYIKVTYAYNGGTGPRAFDMVKRAELGYSSGATSTVIVCQPGTTAAISYYPNTNGNWEDVKDNIYSKSGNTYTKLTEKPSDWMLNYTSYYTKDIGADINLFPQYGDATLALADMPVPKRAEYFFRGWYRDPELTDKIVDVLSSSVDVTVYAKWVPIPKPVYQFTPEGNWKEKGRYVWQMGSDNQWHAVAPVYKMTEAGWINISEPEE